MALLRRILAVTFFIFSVLQHTQETGVWGSVQSRSGYVVFSDTRGVKENEVALSNSRLSLKLWRTGMRGGSIKSLAYRMSGRKETIELLQTETDSNVHKDNRPAYWDIHWAGKTVTSPGKAITQNRKCSFDNAKGADRLSSDGEEMLGVSFQSTTELKRTLPIHTQVHYAMKDDISGVYCTLKVNHEVTDPAVLLAELRLVMRLNPEFFDYGYIADDRQRFMHSPKDIDRSASSRLLFKEARLLTKPENRSQTGQVDHKYMHSVETKDSLLYGWVSSSLKVGVWMISPNKWEYLGGGPTKQELSIQTGPKMLNMLHSRHFGTPAIDLKEAEEWQKVFGPFLIYVNEAEDINDLILDAKARAADEARSWPYNWVPFTEYKGKDDRGVVIGRVMHPNKDLTPTSAISWIGLIDEKSDTSNWEDEVKGYQFWNFTHGGDFRIYNVRPGTYVLHVVVHGLVIDTSVLQTVIVKENRVSDLGDIELQVAQKGSIVWEIGYPDRSAAEFMIPAYFDPNLGENTTENAFRQYGLWDKYDQLYPEKDPVFVVGESDWKTDWYYAHVLRPNSRTTQREISFRMDSPIVEGEYTLRLAIAGAHQAAVEVRVNNPEGSPLYDTGAFGRDNALARGGVHGHYYEFSISISHMNFHPGENSIYLHQRRKDGIFNHIMYDYLRLEAPLSSRGFEWRIDDKLYSR